MCENVISIEFMLYFLNTLWYYVSVERPIIRNNRDERIGKMKIRKISALLIAVMILGLMAGCGKSSEKDATDIDSVMKNYSKYVELGKYKGVEYTPQKTEVTEDMLQYYIDNLVAQQTTTENATEGIATMGDTVNIDYVGSIDGKEFETGNTNGAGTELVLGSHSYVDDFEEQIAGHSPGDAFDVNVTFPSDYGNAELAGKKALFKTKLNSIVIKHEPKYDDALVASATDSKYKTTKEFEEGTMEDLKKQAEEGDKSTNRNAVFEKVQDGCNVTEYPEKEVEKRVQSTIDNVEKQAESNGTDINTFLANYGYDMDKFKDEIKSSTETFIRQRMIISAIAVEEGITVTDEEAEAKVKEYLEQTGISDKETLKQTYGYEDIDFYFDVLDDKVLDFLVENAVEVEATETDATEEDAAPTEIVDDYGTTEEKTTEEKKEEE